MLLLLLLLLLLMVLLLFFFARWLNDMYDSLHQLLNVPLYISSGKTRGANIPCQYDMAAFLATFLAITRKVAKVVRFIATFGKFIAKFKDLLHSSACLSVCVSP